MHQLLVEEIKHFVEQILILRSGASATRCQETSPCLRRRRRKFTEKKQNKMLIWRKDFYNQRFSDASSSVLHQVEFFLSACETVSLPLMRNLLCQTNAIKNNYRFTGKESEHATMEDGGMRKYVSFLFQLYTKVQVQVKINYSTMDEGPDFRFH